MSAVAYDATVGALTLRQCRSTDYQPNVRWSGERKAGALAADQIVIVEARPQVMWQSSDLASIIAGMSMTAGLPISAGSWIVPWLERATGGTFQGATSHTTLSGANGLAIPTSFYATQGDVDGATCDLALYACSADGQAQPVAANVNQSVIAAAFVASYEFGRVKINGSQLTKSISARVNTGLAVIQEIYDGDDYPKLAGTFIDAENIQPSMVIEFANMAALATYGPLFAAMTSAEVFFRKRADGGTTVSDVSLVHCKFSFAGGLAVVESQSGQNAQTGRAQLTLVGKTLTVSAASAVS